MKTIQTLALSLSLSIAALASASTAQAQPTSTRKWDFQKSHGMEKCTFTAYGTDGASTNVEITQTGSREVKVTVQEGTSAQLKLQCSYPMTWDADKSVYSIGSEVSYSANPGGAGTTVGQLAPDDATPKAYQAPLGRVWTVKAGSFGSPSQLVTLTGGSDSIRVTIVAGQSPASKADLKPIEDKNKDTGNRVTKLEEETSGGYEKRTFALNLAYLHDVDSIDSGDKEQDRRGIGAGLHFFVKPWTTPLVKLTLGVEFDRKWRQKPVAAAPDVAPNGFNSYVDSASWTLTPMVGFDVMPASFFQLYLRGGVGLMVHEDPTAILSQDSNKWVFGQESHASKAFAYRVDLGFNFVIPTGDKVNMFIGPSIGVSGNFTKLPEAAGPEMTCGVKIPQCTRLREGYFADWPLMIKLGGQFNLL